MKDKEKAEAYLKKEIEVAGDLNSRMELLQFYLTNNLLKKALVLGNEILKLYPDAADVKQVVEQLKGQV